MASVGHVAVGWFAARGRLRAFAGWSAVALAADVDVIGFRFGVPYAAPFGHRGATHSIAAAVLLALAVAAVTRRARPGLIALAVALSHPLLDMLTDGGLGVALFWPLSNARYFAPWRPIPVAPIGARLLSARGLHVMLVELALFAPMILWTLWSRRRVPAR